MRLRMLYRSQNWANLFWKVLTTGGQILLVPIAGQRCDVPAMLVTSDFNRRHRIQRVNELQERCFRHHQIQRGSKRTKRVPNHALIGPLIATHDDLCGQLIGVTGCEGFDVQAEPVVLHPECIGHISIDARRQRRMFWHQIEHRGAIGNATCPTGRTFKTLMVAVMHSHDIEATIGDVEHIVGQRRCVDH